MGQGYFLGVDTRRVRPAATDHQLQSNRIIKQPQCHIHMRKQTSQLVVGTGSKNNNKHMDDDNDDNAPVTMVTELT